MFSKPLCYSFSQNPSTLILLGKLLEILNAPVPKNDFSPEILLKALFGLCWTICPIPGGIQGQAGCGSGQPGLVVDDPAHGRGLKLDDHCCPFQPKPFYVSMIFWPKNCWTACLFATSLLSHFQISIFDLELCSIWTMRQTVLSKVKSSQVLEMMSCSLHSTLCNKLFYEYFLIFRCFNTTAKIFL